MEYVDYKDYEEVYQKTVEKGIRSEECKASEAEWLVLSSIAQEDIFLRLKREMADMVWD